MTHNEFFKVLGRKNMPNPLAFLLSEPEQQTVKKSLLKEQFFYLNANPVKQCKYPSNSLANPIKV